MVKFTLIKNKIKLKNKKIKKKKQLVGRRFSKGEFFMNFSNDPSLSQSKDSLLDIPCISPAHTILGSFQ